MSTTDPIDDARELMENFMKGPDRSVAAAHAIEVALDPFGDQEPFASVALALASYRPEGGPLVYDEARILPLVRHALVALYSLHGDG